MIQDVTIEVLPDEAGHLRAASNDQEIPDRDYPLGATYQPHERALQMTVAQLKDVRAAAASVAGKHGAHRFDDFITYNQPGTRDQLNLIAHGLLHRVRVRIPRHEDQHAQQP
jgi:hypothetical protein